MKRWMLVLVLLGGGIAKTEAAGAAPAGRVAFADADAQGQLQIFTADPDGRQRRQVTVYPGKKLMPTWSPDGTHLAYVAEAAGESQIHLSTADGAQHRVLVSGGRSFAPAWSPDGRRIAYAHTPNVEGAPRFNLWVADVEGPQRQRVTEGAGNDLVPTWSPDGRQLAFFSERDAGQARIWVLTLADRTLRALTPGGYDAFLGAPIEQKMPAWSPDGQYIAYWSGVEMTELSFVKANGGQPPTTPPAPDTVTDRDRQIMAGWHIWLIRPDGSGARRITQGDDPAWSPDSNMVLFPAATPEGRPAVGAATIDKGARQILFSLREQASPGRVSWRK